MEYIAYYAFVCSVLCFIGAGKNKLNIKNADIKKWKTFRFAAFIFSVISASLCFIISRDTLRESAEAAGIFLWIPLFLTLFTLYAIITKSNPLDYNEVIELNAEDYTIASVSSKPYMFNKGLVLKVNDGRRISADGFQISRPVKCKLYVKKFGDAITQGGLWPEYTLSGYEILEPYKTPFMKTAFTILALALLFACPFTLTSVNAFVSCVATIIFSALTALTYGNKLYRYLGIVGTVIFGLGLIAAYLI